MKLPILVGATIVVLFALLPGPDERVMIGLVLAPLAAVWLAVKKYGAAAVGNHEGAAIGFRSIFSGLFAASMIHDTLWQVLNYRLWDMAKLEEILAWLAAAVNDSVRPFAWTVVTFQVVAAVVLAAIFGPVLGLLGVRLFARRGKL